MKISPATIEEIKNYLKAKKNQPKQTNTTLQTRQQNKTVSQRNYFKPLRNITSKHYLNYFKKEQRKGKHLPSVSVFPEGLILFKSRTNVQLWPSIIHLSSAS